MWSESFTLSLLHINFTRHSWFVQQPVWNHALMQKAISQTNRLLTLVRNALRW